MIFRHGYFWEMFHVKHKIEYIISGVKWESFKFGFVRRA